MNNPIAMGLYSHRYGIFVPPLWECRPITMGRRRTKAIEDDLVGDFVGLIVAVKQTILRGDAKLRKDVCHTHLLLSA